MSCRFLLAFSVSLIGNPVFADTTVSASAKFAFGTNVGWINFRHDQPASPTGVVFGDHFLSGNAYAANFGWVDFGNGTPANGIRYQNNGSDFGVNHDGRGNLSGYAYSANTGWINFGWAAAGDANRPRVDLLTGNFNGFAYSANLGWINLGGGNLNTVTMRFVDSDGDGLADAWERTYFGNLTTATATSDYDKDGASDKTEYTSGTVPNDPGSFFRIASTSYNANYTAATVVFTTDPSRLYRLETSDSLEAPTGTWQDSALGTFAPDAGVTTTKTISWPSTGKKFIRAVATQPLQP